MTLNEWPIEGLEAVNECPICRSKERELLYSGLTDCNFSCAPGKWNFYRCLNCRSAYLNPRPNKNTIELAYGSYFTHSNPNVIQNYDWCYLIKRFLNKGYHNYRFGSEYSPKSFFGVVLATILIATKVVMGRKNRSKQAKARGKILDVGCGNGLFLGIEKEAGWEPIGIDIDPKAVEICKNLGFDARLGEITTIDFPPESFDAITMNHVIEHVTNPIDVLKTCYKLLKPGGWLWLETPNLDSQGHTRYKEKWLAFDTPRHLIVFSRKALQNALTEANFTRIEDKPYFPLCLYTFPASQAIAEGRDPNSEPRPMTLLKLLPILRRAERNAQKNPAIREFISVEACKI